MSDTTHTEPLLDGRQAGHVGGSSETKGNGVMFQLRRKKNLYRRPWSRRGAISTEYVIILVLIAIGGILVFMLFGGGIRKQVMIALQKFEGTKETPAQVDPSRYDPEDVDMSGGEGAQVGELQP